MYRYLLIVFVLLQYGYNRYLAMILLLYRKPRCRYLYHGFHLSIIFEPVIGFCSYNLSIILHSTKSVHSTCSINTVQGTYGGFRFSPNPNC
jgi:hypothetical protein